MCRVVELTGDVTPDMRAIAQADLIVTTPEKWDGVSRSWQNRSYVQKVAILIIDEIHLLGKSPEQIYVVTRCPFVFIPRPDSFMLHTLQNIHTVIYIKIYINI